MRTPTDTARRDRDDAARQRRTDMWHDIALKALLYLGGAAAASILAMVILVVP